MALIESIQSVFRSRTTQRVLGFLFAAAVIFGAYLIAWVSGREKDLTARNFRVLAGVGKQVESILETWGRAYSNRTGSGQDRGSPGDGTEDQRGGVQVTVQYPGERIERPRGTSVSPPPEVHPKPAGGDRGQNGKERKGEPEEEKPVCGDLEGEIERVNPVLSRSVFDYIAVADKDGKIKFEQENREIRLAHLEAIRSKVLKASKDAGWEEKEEDEEFKSDKWGSTVRIRRVPISGVEHEIFLRPIRVQCRDGNKQAKDQQPQDLFICGVVRTDRFLNEARALPGPQLALILAFVVGAILGWPLLKLRSIAEWESLSRFDLAWLASAMFLLPALLTMAVYGGWSFYQMRNRTDNILDDLATKIEGNVRGETQDYHRLLIALDSKKGLNDYLNKITSPKEDLQKPEADLIKNEDEESLKKYFEEQLRTKPFFNLYWIWKDGWQVYKINFGAPTKLIDLKDRAYFRSLAGDVRRSGRSLAIESIHSWTSGQPEVVLAMRRRNGPSQIPVVAIATPLRSLIDPVLPQGFGYAVLQNREDLTGPERLELGEVLLHSDKSRNLRENFLQESSQALWLHSALVARAKDSGSLVYQGRYQRAHTRPLGAHGQPWSLVVFADSDVLDTVVWESVAITFVLFALYSLLVALLFGGYSLSRGTRGWDWLWPRVRELRPRRSKDYVLLIWFFTSLTLFLGAVFYFFQQIEQMDSLLFVALLPAMVLFLLHVWLGPPAGELGWHQRIRILMTAAIFVYIGLLLLWAMNRERDLFPWLWVTVLLVVVVFSLAYPKVREYAPIRSGTVIARSQKPYALCMALGIVLLTVLPTAVFFKIAFLNEIELLGRSGQAYMARQIEERGRRLGRELGNGVVDAGRTIPYSVSYPSFDNIVEFENDVKVRLKETEEYDYVDEFFQPESRSDSCLCTPSAAQKHSSNRQHKSIRTLLRSIRPLYGKRSVETGGFFEDARFDHNLPVGEWRYCLKDLKGEKKLHLFLCYPSSSSIGWGPNRIETKPAPGLNPDEWYLLFLALLASAGIVFLLIRFVVGSLFFDTVRGEGPAGGPKKFHLVLHGKDLPELRRSSEKIRRFDLKNVEESLQKKLDEDAIVVIENFDAQVSDAAEARRRLIQKAAGRRLVLIVSNGPNGLLEGPPEWVTAPTEDSSGSARDPLDWVKEPLKDSMKVDAGLLADVRRLENWLLQQGAKPRPVLDFLGEALQSVSEAQWPSVGGPKKFHLVLCGDDLPELRRSSKKIRRFDLKNVEESLQKKLDEDAIVVIENFDAQVSDAAEARRRLIQKAAGRRLVLIVSNGPNRLLEVPSESVTAPAEGQSGSAEDPLDWVRKPPKDSMEVDAGLLADVRLIEDWLLHQGATIAQVLDVLGEALQPVHEAQWQSLETAGSPPKTHEKTEEVQKEAPVVQKEERKEVQEAPAVQKEKQKVVPTAAQKEAQKDSLILHALANGNWVTLLASRRLRRLYRSGLVTLIPRPRIANRSLAAFLRRHLAEEEVLQMTERSPWQKLKGPLGLGLTLVLMFLFITQRDFFDYLLAMLGAVTTGLTAVLQLFSKARETKEAGGEK